MLQAIKMQRFACLIGQSEKRRKEEGAQARKGQIQSSHLLWRMCRSAGIAPKQGKGGKACYLRLSAVVVFARRALSRM